MSQEITVTYKWTAKPGKGRELHARAGELSKEVAAVMFPVLVFVYEATRPVVSGRRLGWTALALAPVLALRGAGSGEPRAGARGAVKEAVSEAPGAGGKAPGRRRPGPSSYPA